MCGLPVPLRATVAVGFVEELLPMLSCPVTEPAVDGLNVSVSVTACPGLSVAGRLMADAEKPLPVTVIDFTVTAEVPVEVKVTVCVVELFTTTPPNEIVVAFTDSVGVPAFNCSETVRDVLPVVAVSVAD
jgi:hypothetical protein